MYRRYRLRRWPFALAAAAALLGWGTRSTAEDPVAPNIHMQNARIAFLLDRAVAVAGERLETSRCRGVLHEFKDASGRPLQAALDMSRGTAADYLRSVEFYGVPAHPFCQHSRILAFTNVGSRQVFVCPEQFAAQARQDALLAEVTVIHEALHSLGLGENPPSPAYISARVLQLCR